MADTLDVIGFEDLTDVTWMPDSKNTLLDGWITAASRALDVIVGPIVTRNVSVTLDGGRRFVELPQWPAASFTSVVEYDLGTPTTLAAESGASISGERYLLGNAGLLYRRSGGCDKRWAAGRSNVAVAYTAGRYATTDDVDERYRAAALMMLRNFVSRELSGGTDTFGAPEITFPGVTFAVPRAVVELLADQVRSPIVQMR